MKKVLSAVLVLVMVFAIIPIGAVTASAETLSGTTGDCTWTLANGVLTISGNGEMEDYECIGCSPWHYFCNEINSVIIEEGVTAISDNAFAWTEIYYVEIPVSVERIGEQAFIGCNNLSAVFLSYRVKKIECAAFECRNLTDVYYNGNYIDRQNLEIIKYGTDEADNNDRLLKADWHYVGYETLIKTAEDTWCYYVGGVKRDHTTLVKYKGVWFYVEDGVWDKKANALVEYKGKIFCVVNGKWNSSTKTLIKYNGEWYGVVKGKTDTSINTLIKYKDKWFYIEGGKWKKDKLIFKYNGKKFYVEDGKVQFNYSGKVKVGGMYYNIKNGKVV